MTWYDTAPSPAGVAVNVHGCAATNILTSLLPDTRTQSVMVGQGPCQGLVWTIFVYHHCRAFSAIFFWLVEATAMGGQYQSKIALASALIRG